MARPRFLRWRTCLATVVVVGLAAACGSTAPSTSGPQASSGGRGNGLDAGGQGIDVGTGAAGSGGAGDSSGSSVAASGSGSGGGTSGSSASGVTGGGSTGGSPGGDAAASGTGGKAAAANGPGVTDSTIYVGLVSATNSAAANAAIGAAGLSQGDDKATSKILIDDINAHGGVAGRKLVPVYSELDLTSPAPSDTEYQRVCDELTQDHKVAVVLSSAENDVFNECLQKRGVFLVDTDFSVSDAARYRRFPYITSVTSMNLDRIAVAEVMALAAQNYFTPWDAALGRAKPTGKAKVGIVTINLASFVHAVDKVLVPALTKLGYGPNPADVIKAPRPESNTDVSGISAAVSNAVLKFRSDGVEHVLILEESGLITVLFTNNAESQRYFPRYGANSQNGQQALLDAGSIPKNQLAGTVGLGWAPALDITPSQNPDNGPYSNDQRRRCIALMQSHGYTPPDPNAKAVAFGDCNSFWFFQQVGNSIGSIVNRDTFMAGVNRLGGAFRPTDTFGTSFSPEKHDGAAAYRHWAFDNGCGCMQYTSGDKPVP